MVTKISENQNSGNFDLCFQGINISGAFLALAAIHSGLKVAIVLNRAIQWDFEPEITKLYPLKISNLYQSYRSIKFFEKTSSLFPSLVYPQRILTVLEENIFKAKVISFIDFMLKRDRDVASFPLQFSKFPSYKKLETHFHNGLLVQEFCFDRNMAIILLLLKCKEMGACIINDESKIQLNLVVNNSFTCLPYQYKQREIQIENFQLNFENNVRIVTHDFELTTQRRKSSTFIHFQIKKKSDQQLLLMKVFNLLKIIGIEFQEKLHKDIDSIIKYDERKYSQKSADKTWLSDAKNYHFEKCCKAGAKRISNALGKSIKFKKMVKALKYNKFDGYGFSMLQADCDEKFDLAKQTGLNYEKFSYYFYRYRENIDDLIELAYQQLNENRTNPQFVWEKVEREFQNQIEKKIFC